MEIDLNSLSETPIRERKRRVIEVLAEASRREGDSAAESMIPRIESLGSRWRKLVAHLPDAPDTPDAVRAVLEGYLARQSGHRLTIRGDQTGLMHKQVETILARLESMAGEMAGRGFLRVDFRSNHVDAHGVAAIAAWAAQNARGMQWRFFAPRPRRLLQDSGLVDAIRSPDPFAHADPAAGFGYLKIPPEGVEFEPDEPVAVVTAGIAESAGLDAASADAVRVILGELTRNIRDHARPRSPAFVATRYNDHDRVLQICAVDRGEGLRRVLATGDDRYLVNAATNPLQWVEAVVEPHHTTRPRDHAGNGLWAMRELTHRHHGTFLIVSGNASYRLQHRRLTSGAWRAEDALHRLPAEWHGTLVGMDLALEGPIDLASVFESLPKKGEATMSKAVRTQGGSGTGEPEARPQSTTGSGQPVSGQDAPAGGVNVEAVVGDQRQELTEEAPQTDETPPS